LLVAFLVLVPSAALVAAGTDGNVVIAPRALPGGVADAEGKVGYLTDPAGTIVAVNLENGNVLWESKDAVKPLIVLGKKLLAQAPLKDKGNGLRIVALASDAKGKKLQESEAVIFPDWVSLGSGLGRSFSSQTSVFKNELLLKWEARAWYVGGARPTPEIEEAARKHATGIAKVNLESGRVDMLGLDKDPRPAAGKLPAGAEKVMALGGRFIFQDKQVIALALEVNKDEQKLVMKSWDLETNKPKEDVTLFKGKALRCDITADGQHVLVHQSLTKNALPKGDYAWWIFTLETGKEIAKVPYEEGTTQITVLGPRAYFMVQAPKKGGKPGPFGEQNRTVKAQELKTGNVIWERTVEVIRIVPPPP